MTKKIQKAIRDFLSKIKNYPNVPPRNWILFLSGCVHPKTTSFAVGGDQSDNLTPRRNDKEEPADISAKLADIDLFLAENFKSLYGNAENRVSFSTESSESSLAEGDADSLPELCVAVLACSSEPTAEFRRSMRDVVEGRLRREKSLDWVFMEEILMCYLGMNDKRSHGFVLSAFVDLVVELRPSQSRMVSLS